MLKTRAARLTWAGGSGSLDRADPVRIAVFARAAGDSPRRQPIDDRAFDAKSTAMSTLLGWKQLRTYSPTQAGRERLTQNQQRDPHTSATQSIMITIDG